MDLLRSLRGALKIAGTAALSVLGTKSVLEAEATERIEEIRQTGIFRKKLDALMLTLPPDARQRLYKHLQTAKKEHWENKFVNALGKLVEGLQEAKKSSGQVRQYLTEVARMSREEVDVFTEAAHNDWIIEWIMGSPQMMSKFLAEWGKALKPINDELEGWTGKRFSGAPAERYKPLFPRVGQRRKRRSTLGTGVAVLIGVVLNILIVSASNGLFGDLGAALPSLLWQSAVVALGIVVSVWVVRKLRIL
jgi:hypothetical protein